MQNKEGFKTCGLCKELITDRKSYRQVKSNEDFCRIFSELNLRETSFVCKFCVNKLNRLVRIDNDIENKLAKLYEKRNELLMELQKTVASKAHLRTPVNNKRERQKSTPTPRKPKILRLLPFSNSPRAKLVHEPVPIKSHLSEQPTESFVEQFQPLDYVHTEPHSTKDISTQTTCITYLAKDFDVKITAIYGGSHRSAVVYDPIKQAVCKALLNNSNNFVHHLMKSERYKQAVLQEVCKEIRKEISNICRKEETELHFHTEVADWNTLQHYLIQKAPVTVKLLQTVLSKDIKESKLDGHKIISLCTGFSVFLFSRNHTLSRLQYTVGLLMDQCGATKEAISVLHDLGISVSPSALHKKKSDIVLKQEEIIQSTVGRYVAERREIMTATKLVKDYEEFQDHMSNQLQPEKEPLLYQRTDIPVSPKLLSNGCGAQLDAFTTAELWDSPKSFQ